MAGARIPGKRADARGVRISALGALPGQALDRPVVHLHPPVAADLREPADLELGPQSAPSLA